MTMVNTFRTTLANAWPFDVLPRLEWARQRPTFAEASPAVIGTALTRSQRRPSGNWYVVCASTDVARKPFGANVGGYEVVLWRDDDGAVHAGPGECPHLGADLSTGTIDCGALVCPWHGLRITGRRQAGWRPHPVHDDGVLVWVRLDELGGETPTEAPVLAHRPPQPTIATVARVEGTCEPQDVIANRLDPWHGAWFHPYSFTRLDVLEAPPATLDLPDELDRLEVAVTFRMGPLGIPVIAAFVSPEPRTITMVITAGEGAGSVVETHATPLAPSPDGSPRTAVIEAVIAHSDRPKFGYATALAPVITPLARRVAARLWRDDMVYAERLFALRKRTPAPGEGSP